MWRALVARQRKLWILCLGMVVNIGWLMPGLTDAATVNVATSVQDGEVVVKVNATFDSCERCNDDGYCTTINSGEIHGICSASGKGSASCSKSLNQCDLHGEHSFTETANDCSGVPATKTVTLEFDNTPTITITGPTGVQNSQFDVSGVANFKPTMHEVKGVIWAQVDSKSLGSKTCYSENCSYSYFGETGLLADVTRPGEHQVVLTAVGCAPNVSDVKKFTMDNTPISVEIYEPTGVVKTPVDIIGKATFRPTNAKLKGTLQLTGGRNGSYSHIQSKNCGTEECSFSLSESGTLYDSKFSGEINLKLEAKSGGISKITTHSFTFDKDPDIFIAKPIGTVSNPFKISGNVKFKPTLTDRKGSIHFNIDGQSGMQKSCLIEDCRFDSEQLYRTHGEHEVVVYASAGVGGTRVKETQTFFVDNTPEVRAIYPKGTVTSPSNIIGTATFKPTPAVIKGIITAYIDDRNVAGKKCTTEECTLNYEDMHGDSYPIKEPGSHTLTIVAEGGGATASDQLDFTVYSEALKPDLGQPCP
jgi:hypothetical protein